MPMELSVILNSKIARTKDARNTPGNFITKFDRRIELDAHKRYSICLHRLQSSYSWYNISAALGNNFIRYSPDSGTTWKNIIFPNGAYSYADINDYIHKVMKNNGDYITVGTTDAYNINLDFSVSTLFVTITITGTYQFDIFSQAFGNLIGFDVAILTTTSTSIRLPDITNGIDNIQIHCSAVIDSIVDGSYGDILFEYGTSTLIRSFSYEIEPINLIWNRVGGSSFDTIRMITTDVTGKEIDFNGIDVSYTILIREDV